MARTWPSSRRHVSGSTARATSSGDTDLPGAIFASSSSKIAASTFSAISAAPLQGLAGDDHLLDLAGALVDAEDAHVAVEPLDPMVGDVARPAENLHRPVGDAPHHLGGEILGRRGLHGDALAGVALAGGLQGQGLGR